MAKKKQPHARDIVTAEQLEEIARRISWIAKGYEAVAAEMRERKIPDLEISGFQSLKTYNVPRIAGNLGQVQRVLTLTPGSAAIPKGKSLDIHAEAKQARDKLASRQGRDKKK